MCWHSDNNNNQKSTFLCSDMEYGTKFLVRKSHNTRVPFSKGHTVLHIDLKSSLPHIFTIHVHK